MFTVPRSGLSILGGLAWLALLAPAAPAQAPRPAEIPKGQNRALFPEGQRLYELFGEYPHANTSFALLDADPVTGLSLAEVDAALRSHVELPEGRGVVVSAVAEDSPAAEAGVQAGDILVELAGTPLAKPGDVKRALDGKEGDQDLKLIRMGREKTVSLKPPAGAPMAFRGAEIPEYWIGLSIAGIDPALRAQLDLPEGRGILAAEVTPDSPADKAGLKPNDILVEFDGEPIADRDDLVKRVQANKDRPAELKLIRGGEPTTVEITPEKRPAFEGRVEPGSRSRPTWNFDWQMVRPGIYQWPVVPGGPAAVMPRGLPGGPGPARFFQGPAAAGRADGDLEKKLDALTDEVQQLRRSITQLRKDLAKD